MEKLEFTIAGGWWWCERCRKHHVECSPCPQDPNYVAPDPEKVKARLDEAINRIRESEALRKDRVLEEVKKYIPEIEVQAYTCLCAICGRHYQFDNKRSSYCGCI